VSERPSPEPASDEASAAPRPSSFHQWRKRLGPLVLFIAAATLINETCHASDRREVTLRLDLGAAAPRVRHLWADVFVDGESVAQYQRVGGISTVPEMSAHLSGEQAELRIDVSLAPEPPATEPTRKVITRKIRGEGGSTVTIPIGDDLSR
jgi:hypothetical protein